MSDQLANAVAAYFLQKKRPRRAAQDRLTDTGYLDLHLLPAYSCAKNAQQPCGFCQVAT
jgi:hypothetical protein